MSVRELIALLQTLPPGLPVVYFNQCADDGTYSVAVNCAEVKTHLDWGGKYHAPDGMPAECVMLE